MVFLPSMRVEAMENRIRNLAPNQFEFVAEYDGEVVGFVGLTQSPKAEDLIQAIYSLG